MPSNHDARLWATKHLGTCLPFSQTQGHCAGLVAWWIRARFQGKSQGFWTTKNYFLDGGPPYIASGKGLAKSIVLQSQMQGKDAYVAYIISGERSDKPNKFSIPGTAKIKGSKSPGAISDQDMDCAAIRAEFLRVVESGWVGRFTVTTRDATVLHAVALDGSSKKYAHYFDPNLGEFEFMDAESFCDWWCECYQDWSTDPTSTFGLMTGKFAVDYFGI